MKHLILTALVSASVSIGAVYIFADSKTNTPSVSQRGGNTHASASGQRGNRAAEITEGATQRGGQKAHRNNSKALQGTGNSAESDGMQRQNRQANGSDRGRQNGGNKNRNNADTTQRGHQHEQKVAGFIPSKLEASIREMSLKLALSAQQQSQIRSALAGYQDKSEANSKAFMTARKALKTLSPVDEHYHHDAEQLIKQATDAMANTMQLSLATRYAIYGSLNETQQTILNNMEQN